MFLDMDCCGLTGVVVTPDDPEYNEARQEYNRAIQKFPLAIVYCLKIRDVQNAVLWARRNCAGIRIRSGGHNYEGYSVGNCVLVIDLSRMNAVRVDTHRHTVRVQGGASNGEVYARLAQAGLPFNGGSCHSVGVSGFAMGGGWNFYCRHWGLGCDWLRELQLVNWEGEVLTASEDCNPDLYWACRGGGDGNFGVAVSFTFGIPPKPGRVTYFTLDRPGATAGEQASFLSTWQRWLPNTDPRIGLRPSLYNSAGEGRSIFSRGVFFGQPDEARRLLRPLVRSADLELQTRYVTFDKAVRLIAAAYPPFESFKATGRFAGCLFTDGQIADIVSLLDELPEGLEMIELGLFAMGGRVASVCPCDTAFFYRNASYILGMQAVWTDPEGACAGGDWVRRAFRTIAPLTEGSYVNFPYDELVDYERAYYGGNVPRLTCVKSIHDPEDVFNYPQSIRLTC